MGLPRIDTTYRTLANSSDPDVTWPDAPPNTWGEVGPQCQAGSGATRIRARALTGLEVHSVKRDADEWANARWLTAQGRAAVHPDDREAFDALPWQYQLSLGHVVSDWSTPKPDPTIAPA
jgi:hypothetical protein